MPRKKGEKLERQRTVLNSRVQNFGIFVGAVDWTQVSVGEFKIRLEKVKGTWDEFQTVQSEIEELALGEAELLTENEYRDKFEALYFKVTGLAEDALAALSPLPSSPASATITSPDSQNFGEDLRLPPLLLPTFAGAFDEWTSFFNIFTDLVHENKRYSDPCKLKYLKNSLRGEAYDLIGSLDLTKENYDVALNLLKSRFDNPVRAVKKHVHVLFELPKIEKESGKSLRNLLDSARKHIRALKNLKQPTEQWDVLLVHLITSKLDKNTLTKWLSEQELDKLPTMDELAKFMERRCQVLDELDSKGSASSTSTKTVSNSKTTSQCMLVERKDKICAFCKSDHKINSCPDFVAKPVEDRFDFVKLNRLCLRCLGERHRIATCLSNDKCRICDKTHNSLLHRQAGITGNEPSGGNSELNGTESSAQTTNTLTSCTEPKKSVVLLSTAKVTIFGPGGKKAVCRALLDCGSQSNFLLSSLSSKLGLRMSQISVTVRGVEGCSMPVYHKAEARIASRVTNYTRQLDFLIVPKITEYTPEVGIESGSLILPPNIVLADPDFTDDSEIEMLLGAEIFWDLLGRGHMNLTEFSLTLHETKLGWLVAGKSTSELTTHCYHLYDVSLESLDKAVRRFWEHESLDSPCHLTEEEIACEQLYSSTTKRDQDGRYVVKIPLKNDLRLLGDSQDLALKRFYSLEKRFQHNAELKSKYQEFIKEYVSLGHMTEASEDELKAAGTCYFVPHHPVFKESSSTTKTRVVFDFSCKTTSGYSLNDISMVGPNIQPLLYNHLVRARTYAILINGDVEKMYRQILIEPEQTPLQLVYWRDSPTDRVKIYKLRTVSYGNSSAPWLATRTLKQIALDYPGLKSSEIIANHFYVDDLITGCATAEEADQIRRQVTEHLGLGGFHIRKWSSNSDVLMETIPDQDREPLTPISFSGDGSVKTLGLLWMPTEDMFAFSTEHLEASMKLVEKLTKRIMLSSICKLFDPLGLVGPVVAKAKIMMQGLWKHEFEWDEPLSNYFVKQWKIFCRTLLEVKKVRVSRQVIIPHAERIEIHGFSDASMEAFGACVYVKSIDGEGNSQVSLLTSKSCVAPLKVQSLPRLELCAALLLVNLVESIKPSLSNVRIDSINYWTDSSIVLAWIGGSPAKWATYVANRVSKIQEHTIARQWKHVATQHNPADLVSRGLYADQLVGNDLWWNGPTWLSQATDAEIDSYGTIETMAETDLPDVKKSKSADCVDVLINVQGKNYLLEALSNISSFGKMVRTMARCVRLFRRRRFEKGKRPVGPVSDAEFDAARILILRSVQQAMFPQDYNDLNQGKTVKPKSPLASLNPFLDSQKLIRVGGRLQASQLTPDKKHPIVLSHGGDSAVNRFTYLIAKEIHEENAHLGPQALLSVMRERYWPLNGRNLVRKVFHKCVDCTKASPRTLEQSMGNLPEARVQPSRPFLNCGLDYAGPILIKGSSRRNAAKSKTWICLFVCLATKAIHIEIVEDLRTESFIATLRRFIARRGKPAVIYCDNASTFVGAKNELKDLYMMLSSEETSNSVVKFLAKDNISWKFIPPRSPNFGGLWECGIKQVKLHLRRMIGARTLTLCELITVLTQVEGCLNSRPLFPLSADPNDLSALTPSHFLIGTSILDLPEQNLKSLPMNRLSRWQAVQQVVQHFWNRWSNEYLQELQKRVKWRTSSENLKTGALVLIKNDQAPQLSWTLGRVEDVTLGPDGRVRVATLKTQAGIFRRNVRLLCPLPLDDNDELSPTDETDVLKQPLQRPGDMVTPDPVLGSSVGDADKEEESQNPLLSSQVV